jgi:hypothetical protein
MSTYRLPEYSLPGMIEKWHARFLANLTRPFAEETPLAGA